MSARSTEELVAHLAAGLAPVRPIAPIRRQLLAVAAAGALMAAVVAAWLGLHPAAVVARGAASTTVLVALAVLALAGLTIGLASRIPGRERLGITASIALAAGALALALVALSGSALDPGPFAASAGCSTRSVLLAILPGVVAMRLALRGAALRPWISGLGLTAGASALGALLVHLSCPSPNPGHWLLAHALAPLALGAPIGIVAGRALEVIGRRARAAPLL